MLGLRLAASDVVAVERRVVVDEEDGDEDDDEDEEGEEDEGEGCTGTRLSTM